MIVAIAEEAGAVAASPRGRVAATGLRRVAPATAATAAMLTLAATFCAVHLLSSFRMYDDEGYMMQTVAHLMGGRAPYDEVPTFYGPSYYAIRLLLHEGAGIGLTHENVRGITAGFWLAAAGLGSLVAWRLSGRAAAAALCFLAAVAHLAPAFRGEPGHPQDLATTLTLLIAATASLADGRRPGRLAAVLGGLVAWLVLVKVNLGVFAGLAVLLTLASSTGGRAARAATLALSAAATALPLLLMRDAFGHPGWPGTAASMALGNLGVCLMALGGPRPLARNLAATAAAMAAGAALAAVPPIAVVLARGTSPIGLLDGVVLAPLRLGSMAPSEASPVLPIGVAWAGLGAAAAAALAIARRRGPVPRRVDDALGALKGLFGLAVVLARLYPHPSTIFGIYTFSVPLAWLVLATPGPDAVGAIGRRALGLLSALMALQIYPVAGSQRECGSALLVPIAAVCLADAVAWAGRRAPSWRPARLATAAALPATAAMAFALLACWAVATANLYRALVPPGDALRGRGADRVRFAERDAATLQWLAANLSRHADAFQCSSGLNSLHAWTGLPSPTPVVVGNSLAVCPDAPQRAIARALAAFPRAVAVARPGYFDDRSGVVGPSWLDEATDPLLVAFREEYASCGSVDGYDFRVRRGRPRPILVDCVRVGDGGRIASAILSAAPGAEVCRAQVVDPTSHAVLADTRPGDGVPALRAVEADSGASLPPAGDGGIGLAADRRLTLEFREPLPTSGDGPPILRLIGRDGDTLRSIPFLD